MKKFLVIPDNQATKYVYFVLRERQTVVSDLAVQRAL